MSDFFSYCVPDRVFFGHYPTSRESLFLTDTLGVDIFVDLTTLPEQLPGYQTRPGVLKVRFPIVDMCIPEDTVLFCSLVQYLIDSIDTHKIYIHCRGGNGRSGILVASILALLYNISGRRALEMTRMFHSRRPNLKRKYLLLGSPQTADQKRFVVRLFSRTVIGSCSHILSPVNIHGFEFQGVPYDNIISAVRNSTCAVTEQFLEDILKVKLDADPRLAQCLMFTALNKLVVFGLGNVSLDRMYSRVLMRVRRRLFITNYMAVAGAENVPAVGHIVVGGQGCVPADIRTLVPVDTLVAGESCHSTSALSLEASLPQL